ncbi:MAG TPA: GlxA family transcriptional regulator [Methylovirgula sp.]|nr:GlxA family transcriptional regulator [Methylovirgula sp.]
MTESDKGRTRRIGFLLIDGFALMSFASAIEPLRAANVLAGRALYDWVTIGIGRHEVMASSGFAVRAQHLAGADIELDTVFVCAGGNPATFADETALNWLRRLARRGVRIGGVSGGPFILARAGLLAGYRCTIHWEHVPAFVETYPDLNVRRSLYEIDRDRLTCAGGVAALDMMHAMISAEHGRALADEIGEWFLQTEVRLGTGAQRRSLQDRYDTSNARLLTALDLIETHIEDPLDRRALSTAAGVSVRQLERLFAAHLGKSLERHYRDVRLDRARLLLRQTTLSVSEVGLASGFQSASHFSRAFKARFGHAPALERARRHPAGEGAQLARFGRADRR